MKNIIIILLLLIVSGKGFGQKLANGTVIGYEPDGSASRIGDTAWRYVKGSWDRQTMVLKSTSKYPTGIWTPVGKPIKMKDSILELDVSNATVGNYNQFDSLTYYEKQYKLYISKYTNSRNFKEINRYVDSAIRFRELIDRLKK